MEINSQPTPPRGLIKKIKDLLCLNTSLYTKVLIFNNYFQAITHHTNKEITTKNKNKNKNCWGRRY